MNSADRARIPSERHQPPLFYAISAGLLDLIGKTSANPSVEPNPAFPKAPNAYVHSPQELAQSDSLVVHLLRFVSTLAGLATVYLTYKISRELQLTHSVGVLAAGINALIPQFTFLTAVVSNDSLSWATSSLALLLTLRLFTSKGAPKNVTCIFPGIALGLAFLTKGTTLILIPFVGGVMLLKVVYLKEWTKSDLLRSVLCVGSIVAIIAGWWYLRNHILYGEPTGCKLNAELNPSLIRQKSIWSPYFRDVFPKVTFASFWGVFGWMNVIVEPALYVLYLGLMTVAFVRLCVQISDLRTSDGRSTRIQFCGLLVLLAFALLALIELVIMNLTLDNTQGRFMYVAISAISVLMSVGLTRAFGGRQRYSGAASLLLLMGLFVLNAYFLFFLRTVYWPLA